MTVADRRAKKIRDLGPKEDYKMPLWLGYIRWMMGKPCALDLFKKDIGLELPKPSKSLDDIQPGAESKSDFEWLVTFMKWINRNYWGEKDGRAV